MSAGDMDRDPETTASFIQEGKVRLSFPGDQTLLPDDNAAPACARVKVFYNPAMVFNRDVSVLVFNQLAQDGNRLLDGLSASGVRGLRYALEVEADLDITMNDRSSGALEHIRENLALNSSKDETFSGIRLENHDLNALLHNQKFHIIDIDPFGTPVPFLDSAMRALRHRGILAVTATDTSTLCGTYPKASFRRYGSWVPRNAFTHEAGVRNLISTVVRQGARYEKALVPLLSHATHYYYRVYFRMENTRSGADRQLGKLGYLLTGEDPNKFSTVPFSALRTGALHQEEGLVKGAVGPLWLGELFDQGLLEKIRASLPDFEYLPRFKRIEKQLELWEGEASLPPFFYRTDHLGSTLKCSLPKMDKLLEGLREAGYPAVRTHFAPYAVKTTAPLEELAALFP